MRSDAGLPCFSKWNPVPLQVADYGRGEGQGQRLPSLNDCVAVPLTVLQQQNILLPASVGSLLMCTRQWGPLNLYLSVVYRTLSSHFGHGGGQAVIGGLLFHRDETLESEREHHVLGHVLPHTRYLELPCRLGLSLLTVSDATFYGLFQCLG